MMVNLVPIFGVVGLPDRAATAWSTALVPITYGDWAMSPCTVPCCRAVISSGSASNPTIFTLPDLPAWRIPVAAPSAENRLVAKIPTMPGFFCSAASVTCAAIDALSWSYCTPT